MWNQKSAFECVKIVEECVKTWTEGEEVFRLRKVKAARITKVGIWKASVGKSEMVAPNIKTGKSEAQD